LRSDCVGLLGFYGSDCVGALRVLGRPQSGVQGSLVDTFVVRCAVRYLGDRFKQMETSDVRAEKKIRGDKDLAA